MRHTSRRRQSPDPLAPIHAPTWLVVRDRVGYVRACRELPPLADLRAELSTLRGSLISGGWAAEEMGGRCAFFFASRAGERVLAGIERIPPRNPP